MLETLAAPPRVAARQTPFVDVPRKTWKSKGEAIEGSNEKKSAFCNHVTMSIYYHLFGEFLWEHYGAMDSRKSTVILPLESHTWILAPNVGIAMSCLPPIKLMVYTTHRNGDEWGMVYYCYTHII